MKAGVKIWRDENGGPSDRRFSKWYCSDLENWIEGRYKRTGVAAERQISFP
jgi:hypothetical protein